MRALRLLPAALLLACGGSGSGGGAFDPVDPPPGGVAQFSVSPVDLAQVQTLTPLGSLNPPGHVLPTDHVYFYQWDLDQPAAPRPTAVLEVVAPAKGRVWWTYHQPGSPDWKVVFRATEEFSWYLDHLVLDSALAVGTVVEAGQRLGTTTPGGTLDLGAYDTRVTLTGLLNPARYPGQTLHCVSPWQYYAEPLRSQIYARIRRAPGVADKDGQIDFGVAGTLAGDWYEAGLAPEDSPGPLGWPRTIGFVRDYYEPSLVRVSIGGTIAPPGVWTIPPGTTLPEAVTPASGVVSYPLRYTGSTSVQYGLLVVQLLAADTLRVEAFVGDTSATGTFDSAARLYVR